MNIRLSTPAACLGLLIMVSWGCQSSKSEDAGKAASEPQVSLPYPFLGNEVVSQLYSQADHVDIIFYDLPISVNQDDPSSVKNTVLYVSPAAPNVTRTCKPLGRLSWMSQGTILREADIFIEEGCQYLLFMENNQPVAANAMAQAGIDFFKNIVRQVEQRQK